MTRRPDAGETLVEILVTLVIVGMGVAAIMSGLATNINVSDLNRDQAKGQAVLLAAMEYVKAQPWTTAAGALTYPCGSTALVELPVGAVPNSAGYTVRAGDGRALGTDPSSCTDAALPVQLVTVRVDAAGSALQHDVVRRKP